MIQPNKYHILFLTRWFPNRHDVQLGIFIKKHALAVSKFCSVTLLYVQGEDLLPDDSEIEIEKHENFTSVIIYYRKSPFPFINFLRYINYHFKGYKIIKEKYGRPHLMHLHVMYGLGFIVRLMSICFRLPYMVTEHWHGFTDNQFRNKNFAFKWMIRHAAKNAKAISTVSEFLKKKMIENGFNPDIKVIPNVVESATHVSNKSTDVIKFLTVADLVDSIKNISSVIEIMEDLFTEFPDKYFEYHIIGGGVDEEKLRSMVSKKNNLKDKIIFHGRHANEYVLDFISEIDFGIINSNIETFSVFAAELLSAGKPLVCTRCGGVEEFVNDSNALMIETKNKTQLKSALKKLLLNEVRFDSKKIKSEAQNKFSADAVGKMFYDLYAGILNR